MKKFIYLLTFLSLPLGKLNAQEKDFDNFSFGIQLVRFQDEFGIGMHTLSPALKKIRLCLKGNMNWLNHIDTGNNEKWTKFSSFQLGLNYINSYSDKISLYTEGGIVTIFPNSEFSSINCSIGGYGLFGFEFKFSENSFRNSSFFIEIGGVGTNVSADKIISNPIYFNGMLISTGYRF